MTFENKFESSNSAPIPLLDMLQLTYTTELRNLEAARNHGDAMASSDNSSALSPSDQALAITGDVLARLGATPATQAKRTAALFEPPKAPRFERADRSNTPRKLLQLNAFTKPGNRAAAKDIDLLMTTLSDDGDAVREQMAFMDWNFDLPEGRKNVTFDQIPLLHRHFKAVDAHWPYWLHFLAPTRENMARLFILIGNGSSKPGQGGRPGMQITSVQALLDGGSRAIRAAVALQAMHDVPTTDCKRHARAVLDAMRLALTP